MTVISLTNNAPVETPRKPDREVETPPKRHSQPAPSPMPNPRENPNPNTEPLPGVCPIRKSLKDAPQAIEVEFATVSFTFNAN